MCTDSPSGPTKRGLFWGGRSELLDRGNNPVGRGDSAKRQEADTQKGPDEWTLTPLMPRERQGNVDTPFSSNITKEEHHLLTPLPQHLISSCWEPARILPAHPAVPGPRHLPEHPRLQKCIISSEQNSFIPLVQAGHSMAQHQVTSPWSDRLLLQPQRLLARLFPWRMQRAFCKALDLEGNLALS